jgi:nicotianamine synthase
MLFGVELPTNYANGTEFPMSTRNIYCCCSRNMDLDIFTMPHKMTIAGAESTEKLAAGPSAFQYRAHATAPSVTPPRTPTALTTSAYKLLSEIREIHETLSALTSLAPGDPVDQLLTRLVNLCIVPYSAEFTEYFFNISGVASLCEELRPLCATAEGELEKYWANRMIQEARSSIVAPFRSKISQLMVAAAPKPSSSLLASFPYHQNYIDLSRLECSTLEAFLPTAPRNIAFIGSGPLPLTSLCMLDRYPEASVHNIDRDAAALEVSAELCGKLGYYGMTFACEDITAASTTDWESFEVVFLAALVGTETQSKMDILASLATKLVPGTLVVARSAQGLRSVLYPVSYACHDAKKA